MEDVAAVFVGGIECGGGNDDDDAGPRLVRMVATSTFGSKDREDVVFFRPNSDEE